MTTTTTSSRFPLPWSASVAQWWATSSASPLQIQNEIFSLAPFWSTSDHRVAAQQFVNLSGKNRFLNEISVKSGRESSVDASNKGNVVLLHGYGAGVGFYFRNIEGLTNSLVSRMDFYALDWLGMGLSSRPPFKVHAKTPHEKITEAESFFLDALEEWRQIRKIDKMTLVAHSLGGYLAVRYTNKYPERVEKLILVSPVGVPKNPYAKDTKIEPTINNTPQPPSEIDIESGDIDEVVQKNPLPWWISTIWDAQISPFFFVRLAGPFGPKLTSGWTGRRFSHIPEDQQKLLHNYAYELFKGKPSGEYGLAYLLAPGAYARSCLRNVIPTKVPVLMLYGDRDWMDEGAGRKSAEVANKKPGGDVTVKQISDAGHHCYLDNPREFDQVVVDFINRPPRKQSL